MPKTKEEIAAEKKAAAAAEQKAASDAKAAEDKAAADAEKDAKIAELEAKLEASKANESGSENNVPGVYTSKDGKKYGFKPNQKQVRMKNGLIQDSAALIEEANKKDGDPAAKERLEEMIELGAWQLQEIK